MISNLFDGAKLEVDETVTGHDIHADGHFDFVLTRGKTKICIVSAKDSDFVRGASQLLVGCEAVAEREGLHVVYGIVTDFLEWDLYRCGDNSILTDVGLLKVPSRKLDIESLRRMCEMIYGVLSDQEEERKEEKA